MGILGRLFKTDSPAKSARATTHENIEYLTDFVHRRSGVRGFFEATTAREPAALILVADDGEWTRRTVADITQAQKVAQKLGIALFDVANTGYPREMREWNIKNAQRREPRK